MAEQHGTDLIAHPYRVLVPVVPLDLVVRQTGAIEASIGLLRSRDAITPYMYLPPLPHIFEGEQIARLFRPTLVSDELLRDPPRRVAQLQPPARRQLKIKLAAIGGERPSTPTTCRCMSAMKRSLPPATAAESLRLTEHRRRVVLCGSPSLRPPSRPACGNAICKRLTMAAMHTVSCSALRTSWRKQF